MRLFLLLLLLLLLPWQTQALPWAVQAVIDEVAKDYDDPGGYPLPVGAHWHRDTMDLEWQVDKLNEGYPLLPWYGYVYTDSTAETNTKIGTGLAQLATWGMPITLLYTNWDGLCYGHSYFTDQEDPDDTCRAVDAAGVAINKSSPLAPNAPFQVLGDLWTNTDSAARLQVVHPDPPQVFWMSNNEAIDLEWEDANTSKRYTDAYGGSTTEAEKRGYFFDGWVTKIGQFKTGATAGLTDADWIANSKWVVYNATEMGFGPHHYARFGDWDEYALFKDSTNNMSHTWQTGAWDGTSEEAYDNNWEGKMYGEVWSNQMECSNEVFMLEQAYAVNSSYFFELIFWDGSSSLYGNGVGPGSKGTTYINEGYVHSAEAYAGWAQWCMWALRPRVVREWRKSDDDIDAGTLFERWDALMDAVKRVHTNPILKSFWRESDLLPNTTRAESSHYNETTTYDDAERWYHQESSTDPAFAGSSADYGLEMPVWNLVREQGTTPNREWLVYVFAAKAIQTNFTVTIPDHEAVTIPSATNAGEFWLVKESDDSVTNVTGTPGLMLMIGG